MASASLVQVIDLTGPSSPINNGTKKIRKSPNHDVEVTTTRSSPKRRNGEISRTRTLSESRGCSAEVENARLEKVIEIRQTEGAKDGHGESSTKKRSRRSMKSKDKSKDPVSSLLEDTQQDPPPPTLEDSQFFFVVDTAPAPVPASMVFDSRAADAPQSSSSRVPEADKTPPLLLPAHVSVLDVVDDDIPIQIVQPVDSDSDAESYIEYLDYDDRLVRSSHPP
jgi:protein AIR1/2